MTFEKNFALRAKKTHFFLSFLVLFKNVKYIGWLIFFLGWYVFKRAVTKRFQFFQINFKFIFFNILHGLF